MFGDPPQTRHVRSARERSLIWLAITLLASVIVHVALAAVLIERGESAESAGQAIGLSLTPKLLEPTGIDSWKPMAAAYTHESKHPGQMYWVFFAQKIRFQYPPSALLLMKLVPVPLTAPLRETLGVFSRLALVLVIIFATGIFVHSRPSDEGWHKERAIYAFLSGSLMLSLGCSFYPLLKAHNLGQIQVYLDALVAASLFALVVGQRFLSGFCIGLCCLLKPQFAIVIVWSLLRRQPRFRAGAFLAAGIGLLVSLRAFGLNNHLDYLRVLGELSRTGEAFWPNQSVNGILNRYLGNGEAVAWLPKTLPPYHPVIYYSTAVSSLIFIGLALFAPARRHVLGTAVDLAIVIVAATLASPIAWEHHFGVLFPVFALAVTVFHRSRLWMGLLTLSYVLLSVEFLRPELVFVSPVRGLLGAHIFFGALSLFALLLTYRAIGSYATRAPAPRSR
jgi:alpha-1,2-mannosyltransferase